MTMPWFRKVTFEIGLDDRFWVEGTRSDGDGSGKCVRPGEFVGRINEADGG